MTFPLSSQSTPAGNKPTGRVFIGLGSNLSLGADTPRQVLERAMGELEDQGAEITACSSFWTSKAWPYDNPAPDYVNAVCQIRPNEEDPLALLLRLHAIEAKLGRTRNKKLRWSARTLDLDLLDFNMAVAVNAPLLILPHPRIGVRDFVLLPLLEVCPEWVRPTDGIAGAELLAILEQNGQVTARKTIISTDNT